jgi:flotillin
MEREAEAKRRGEVAEAIAERDVLMAEREREEARLEKEQIVQQMIEKKKVEIDADAEAERIRRVAQGEADAILAKYSAEAEGVRKVLEAKAHGYARLIESCQGRQDLAPSLLVIEKLPELIAEQVKAIQNLKIEKITVWDSGGSPEAVGSTAGFLRGMIGALPPVHELARQAGIDLPEFLGSLEKRSAVLAATQDPSTPVGATPSRTDPAASSRPDARKD